MFDALIQEKIEKLINNINSRKEHEYAAATYRDIKDLKEIDELINRNIDDEEASLLYAYENYMFLATEYKTLTRMSIVADYLKKALEVMIKVYEIYKIEEIKEDASSLLSDLLRFRNFFVDDDCLDIKELVKGSGLLKDEKIDEIFEKRMKSRRTLKNDPVEMSPEYLAVIDEVEEKIDKNRKYHGMGSCFETWSLKQEYLAEKGITWTPPNLLNPNVMFD